MAKISQAELMKKYKDSYELENAADDEAAKLVSIFLDYIFDKKEEKGLTNYALAELSGVSFSHIYRLDKKRDDKQKDLCNVGIVTVVRLALALDIDLGINLLSKDITFYGEKFEYLTRNLSEDKKKFILDFVKTYSDKEKEFEEQKENIKKIE